jgi:hypothetical protein
MKSRAAFEFTVLKMARNSRKLYFWTFTYRDVHCLKTAMSLWNEFLTMMKRKFSFRGVRVLELHEEHGAHFHVITDRRFKIKPMLDLGACYGFGRTNVKTVTDVEGSIAYLCKYLSKGRPRCLRRVRLWAAFGDVARTRVADIVSDSPMIRHLREVMGLPSPDELLNPPEPTAPPIKRKVIESRFLQAKLAALTNYQESFDPDFKQRQAMWGELKFHGLCTPSPLWHGETVTFDE